MRFKIIIFLFIVSNYIYSQNFIKIEEWKFNEFIYSDITNAIVDKYENLIIMMNEQGVRIANKSGSKVFANKGQGPGEILFWTSLCKKDDNVAILELYRKMQIFKDTNKGYKWNKNIWREEKDCAQFVSTSIFVDNKWFLGGPVIENNNVNKKESINTILNSFYVRILDNKGSFIKKLVKIKYKKLIRNYLMYSYFVKTEKFIYYIKENEMKVYKISRKNLNYKGNIELKTPLFYRKMPNDFYSFNTKMPHQIKKSKLIFDRWKTAYSAITKAIKYKNYLIIQIRTVNNKTKKFALLLYELQSLGLKKIIFTNDLLLSTGNDKLYFYGNGNPQFDEEANEYRIIIGKIK